MEPRKTRHVEVTGLVEREPFYANADYEESQSSFPRSLNARNDY